MIFLLSLQKILNTMADLQHFTLTQFKQLLDGYDDQMANNYITQNLAIARNAQVSIIKPQLSKAPVVMDEMRILIVKKGWATPTVNLMKRRFEEGDLIFLGNNGILQYMEASDDLMGIGLSMSNDLFNLAIGNRIPKAFDGHLRDFQLHLQPHELDFLDHLHHLIYLHTREDGHGSQTTLHLLSAYLWYIDNLWNHREQAVNQTQSREQRLFSKFIQLVNEHGHKHRHVDFYASQLFISPRYMSTLVKKVSGKAAKEWIDDATITRIKIELKHTDKQVRQISDEMEFPNTSFFCKYFKRMTGITPQDYRRQ